MSFPGSALAWSWQTPTPQTWWGVCSSTWCKQSASFSSPPRFACTAAGGANAWRWASLNRRISAITRAFRSAAGPVRAWLVLQRGARAIYSCVPETLRGALCLRLAQHEPSNPCFKVEHARCIFTGCLCFKAAHTYPLLRQAVWRFAWYCIPGLRMCFNVAQSNATASI